MSGQVLSDNGTLKAESALGKWWGLFKEIGMKTGKTFASSGEARDSMVVASLVNVTERPVKLPIGRWPRKKEESMWGMWNLQFLRDGLQGFGLKGLILVLGVSNHQLREGIGLSIS